MIIIPGGLSICYKMLQALLLILGNDLPNDLISIVVGYVRFEGIQVNFLQGHAHAVLSLVALPDGRLVSGSSDETIRIWDLVTGACQVLKQPGEVMSLLVLPDGRLVCGPADGVIHVWDLLIGTYQTLRGHTDRVMSLAALPDNQFASGSDDGSIRVWDLKTNTSQVLFQHTDGIKSLTVLVDGRLACGTQDGIICLLDPIARRTQVLRIHTSTVMDLAVLSDGQLVSAGGIKDTNIYIWDLSILPTDQGFRRSITEVCPGHDNLGKVEHTDSVRSLVVLPDGRLVSGSRDKTIRIWDLVTGTCQVLDEYNDGIVCLLVLSDGRLVCGFHDKTIRIWI